MKEGNAIVTLINISKSFLVKRQLTHARNNLESLAVLRDISFSIERGEIVGIIGRNGCGKSTLLKLISNILSPTSGEITIKGNYASILDIGNGFHPDLTGRENIRLYHSLLAPDSSPNIPAIISFSELEHFMDTPVKFYSNGMYLRLAFSIAIFCNTDLIIFDEVLSVGDHAFMIKCQQKIIERNKSGTSFLIVSHNQADLLKLCTKCIWLKDGHIKMQGTPLTVITHYLNDLVDDSIIRNTFVNPQDGNNGSLVAHLKKIEVCGSNIGSAEFSESVKFEMIIEQNVPGFCLFPVLVIEDIFGQVVTVSTTILESQVQENILSGEYRFVCLLPPKLLNLGLYKVSLVLNSDEVTNIVEYKNVVEFRIIVENELMKRKLATIPHSVLGGSSIWTQKKMD
jgi:ABC-type polysaccharide/polyol phosphate transport system ATPase subunit